MQWFLIFNYVDEPMLFGILMSATPRRMIMFLRKRAGTGEVKVKECLNLIRLSNNIDAEKLFFSR